MINITKQTVLDNCTIKEPQIEIVGYSDDGSREMIVTYLIVDKDGLQVDVIQKTFTGQDFNTIYNSYNSDKSIMLQTLPDYSKQIETLPDNFINK